MSNHGHRYIVLAVENRPCPDGKSWSTVTTPAIKLIINYFQLLKLVTGWMKHVLKCCFGDLKCLSRPLQKSHLWFHTLKFPLRETVVKRLFWYRFEVYSQFRFHLIYLLGGVFIWIFSRKKKVGKSHSKQCLEKRGCCDIMYVPKRSRGTKSTGCLAKVRSFSAQIEQNPWRIELLFDCTING